MDIIGCSLCETGIDLRNGYRRCNITHRVTAAEWLASRQYRKKRMLQQ
jgi:hypothetical protein